jgi:uncharacterized membrane protein
MPVHYPLSDSPIRASDEVSGLPVRGQGIVVKLGALLRGLPGHPLHPPLTDAAIGAYTAATVLACIGAAGIAEDELAKGWWIALLVALGFGALAALTGLVDWLSISRGTPLWRTATFHLCVMALATVLFVLAAILGHAGYVDGEIGTGALVLVLLGYATMALGGWLGGSIVFVHGMRVLGLPDEPAVRAIAPGGDKKARAEAG